MLDRYRGAILGLLVLFLVAGLYGAGGPFVWGHYGYHAGEYSTRARHTLRHHTLLPSNAPGYSQPLPETYYLHHPILTHQLVTLTLLVFGEREVAVRAAGLISSFACYLLLVALLRRLYGRWQAVLGGALFVLVPIHIWFAPHIDPGLPSIACMLGFFLCYFSWLESGRLSMGLAALGLIGLAGLFEWSPFLAAVPIFFHALFIGIKRRGRYLGWSGLLLLTMALVLAFHAMVVVMTGHLGEMRESFRVRTGGPTFVKTLGALAAGAWELFGAPLILAVLVWLGLLISRGLRKKLLARDLVPVTFAFALFLYAVIFRNSMLIHLYRMLYGGVLCALAGVAIVDSVRQAEKRCGRRQQTATPFPFWAGAVALGLVLGTLPLSILALGNSRRLGGVPLHANFDPGLKPRAFIKRVLALTSKDTPVYTHMNFVIRKDLFFYLDRNLIQINTLSALATRPEKERTGAVVLFVEPLPNAQEQAIFADLSRRYPVYRVDEYTLVDLRAPAALPGGKPRLSRERLLIPAARSLLARYWEGPYSHVELAPLP